MGEAEDRLYSVRLVLRVARKTRVILDVLKRDRVVRQKVSCQSLPAEEKRCGTARPKSRGGMSIFSVGKPRKVEVRKRRCSLDQGCYLCKLDPPSNEEDEPPPPYYEEVSFCAHKNASLVFLPISSMQPPRPPPRTTSLPFFKELRKRNHIQATNHPSGPLNDFRLSWHDRKMFQLFLQESNCTILGELISNILLQACHSEPCILHLILGIASVNLLQNTNHDRTMLDLKEVRKTTFKHYSEAVRQLNTQLQNLRFCSDCSALEILFMSCYLFTKFESLMGNRTRGYKWLRNAFRLLKFSMKKLRSDEYGVGLPGCMRDVAIAFGKLDLGALGT